jgi:hypothetical protein
MVMSPAGLRAEKDCAGENQQQLETTDLTSRQRGTPHQQTRNCLKNNKRKKKKLVPGPKWVPDTKTDWISDRRS